MESKVDDVDGRRKKTMGQQRKEESVVIGGGTSVLWLVLLPSGE